MPAYEKSRSTGAEEGIAMLYFKKICLTVGYLCRMSSDDDLSSKYWRISMSAEYSVGNDTASLSKEKKSSTFK